MIDPHSDEAIYELVAVELAQDGPRAGLWAKAFATANGEEAKAKALYIRWRYDQVKQSLLEEFQRLEAMARSQKILQAQAEQARIETAVSFERENRQWIDLAKRLRGLRLSDAEIAENIVLRGVAPEIAREVVKRSLRLM